MNWKSQGVGGPQRPKHLKESMKVNLNFQGGGVEEGEGLFEKIPSVLEIKIFYGATHYIN